MASATYVGDERRIKAAKTQHVEALRALARLYAELDQDGIAPPGETRATGEAWKAIGIEVPEHWLWEREDGE